MEKVTTAATSALISCVVVGIYRRRPFGSRGVVVHLHEREAVGMWIHGRVPSDNGEYASSERKMGAVGGTPRKAQNVHGWLLRSLVSVVLSLVIDCTGCASASDVEVAQRVSCRSNKAKLVIETSVIETSTDPMDTRAEGSLEVACEYMADTQGMYDMGI